MNLLVLRMFQAKYQCIQASGSGEEDFFKFFCYINLYKIMSPEDVAICDPRDFI